MALCPENQSSGPTKDGSPSSMVIPADGNQLKKLLYGASHGLLILIGASIRLSSAAF
jgi:hypothetical protein